MNDIICSTKATQTLIGIFFKSNNMIFLLEWLWMQVGNKNWNEFVCFFPLQEWGLYSWAN